MKPSVQNIFRENFDDYISKHRVPLKALKAANSIIKCRTKELGGHVQECPEGHYKKVWYNSCKHRACRTCAGIQIEDWLQKQRETILNIDHYHVIFTIPHKLNNIWLMNEKLMTNVLFNASKEALIGMLENEAFLGANPGIIGTLQSWGETLIHHPHTHFIVTGGGLTKNNEWKKNKKGFLVPVKELMKIFRGKFLDKLHNLLYKGKLKIQKGVRYKEVHELFRNLRKEKWNVHISERYAHGEGVIKYLATYIKGGPISNSRIISMKDGKVKFKYEDNNDNKKKKIISLKKEEFIRRFLLHVPQPRLKVVRYYGLYASSKREELNKCRRLMGQENIVKHEKITSKEYLETKGYTEILFCPTCGKELKNSESFRNEVEFEKVKENIIRSGTRLQELEEINIA